MFGNGLNEVDRQSKAFIRIGVSALCWSIWRVKNDIIFNKKKTIFSFLTGYPCDLTLGSAMGHPFVGGTAGCYGFWMHTTPDRRSGYLVSDWLALY
jgi:hypothetical protein